MMVYIGVLILIGFILPTLPHWDERILGIRENIEITGGSGRIYMWTIAKEQALDSILIGKGIGSFLITYGYTVHNSYLLTFVDMGLLGLILYMSILYMGLVSWWKVSKFAKKIGDNRLSYLAFGGFVGLCGTIIHIGTISEQNPGYIWMAVGLGVILWTNFKNHRIPN